MCGRRRSAPTPQATPAPIMGRNPDLTRVSQLPEKREIVDEDDVTSVEYGTSKKAGAQARATGAKQLRIKLNTGTSSTVASTGGVTGGSA
tara:strand:- start:192 stop:461 length:270 start_codon:yes stop_codon:yes gene_type:complete